MVNWFRTLCYIINIFVTERARVEVCALFYYSTEQLNLLDFMMNPTADNNILGRVHEYEAVLWTLEKSRKICYKMINFSLRELKFLGNVYYFSYLKRLALAKVEKSFCYKEIIVTNLSYILLLRKVFLRIIK